MSYVLIDERRERFIAATLNVIREWGVGDATTRRIAEEAGASLASLHYTFSNKEDLFVATMKALGDAGKQEVGAKVSDGMGVADAAATIFNVYIDWVKSSRGDQLIEYELYLWAHRRPDLAHLPAEFYGSWVEFIGELLNRAGADKNSTVDTDSLARAVLALIDGFNLQCQLLDDDRVDFSRAAITKALRRSVANGDFPKS